MNEAIQSLLALFRVPALSWQWHLLLALLFACGIAWLAVRARSARYSLVIIEARWGLTWEDYKVVTLDLEALLATGKDVRATPQFFHDEHKGSDKFLFVKASIDGGRTKKWYKFIQNEQVRFPPFSEVEP